MFQKLDFHVVTPILVFVPAGTTGSGSERQTVYNTRVLEPGERLRLDNDGCFCRIDGHLVETKLAVSLSGTQNWVARPARLVNDLVEGGHLEKTRRVAFAERLADIPDVVYPAGTLAIQRVAISPQYDDLLDAFDDLVETARRQGLEVRCKDIGFDRIVSIELRDGKDDLVVGIYHDTVGNSIDVTGDRKVTGALSRGGGSSRSFHMAESAAISPELAVVAEILMESLNAEEMAYSE